MRRNRGSAVVEVTLLVPIMLGCIYFYIMSMLYLVEHGRVVNSLSERLYEAIDSTEEKSTGEGTLAKGGVESFEERFENYTISLTLQADDSDPVKSLRRWQLIADTVR
ncbi:MAG: hypothetical protein IJ661_00765 [Lachnospiraceae bacterium]|nr:hypothetical protein [Lachnospiraceae bacterium]